MEALDALIRDMKAEQGFDTSSEPVVSSKPKGSKVKKSEKSGANPQLDGEGRVSGTTNMGLRFGFRTYHGLLQKASADWRAQLEADCRVAFVQKSFWLPAGMAPRCALEEMAKAVFEHHTSGVTYDPERSGAEWWCHFRGPESEHEYGESIGFHWDKDEFLADQTVAPPFVHPQISTVLYLSEVGSPTLILEHRVSSSSAIESVSRAHLSHPAYGKHVSFDGRFLHGVPAQLLVRKPVRGGYTRLTFLVNVWVNHVLRDTHPFPSHLLAKLKLRVRKGGASPGQPCPLAFPKSETAPKVISASPSAPAHGWVFSTPWAEGEAWMPLPKELRAAAGTGDSFSLQFSAGCRVRCNQRALEAHSATGECSVHTASNLKAASLRKGGLKKKRSAPADASHGVAGTERHVKGRY